MNVRTIAVSIAVSALAALGLQTAASAAAPGFTVPATTINAGDSLAVTLTDSCVDAEGNRSFGNLNQYNETTNSVVSVRDIKGHDFINGFSNTYTFPTPGEYTLQRFCDIGGYVGKITITVLAPGATTTTAPPAATTTVAVTPTTAPATTSPATTAPVVVEGTTATNSSGTSSSGSATGAVAVKAEVAYTG
ncbi:MAG: hypothetical protein U0Q22_09145 [Acidimicrobiales bacterium]